MSRINSIFITLCAVLFGTTGVLKIIGLVIGPIGNPNPDPLLSHFSLNTTIMSAAVIEIAVTILCLSKCCLTTKIIVVFWLSTVFVLYRFGLKMTGHNLECPCLGYITITNKHLHILAFSLLKWSLAFTMFGSVLFLFFKYVSATLARMKRNQCT